MVGPVFALEMLHQRRRGHGFPFLAWGYAAFLGLQAVFALLSITTQNEYVNPVRPVLVPDVLLLAAKIEALVTQHFVVLFLLTPALAASALGEDKAKGLLPDLFTTALTSTEIVRDKLLARAARALGILLAGLPVICAAAAVAGISLVFFAALLFETLLVVLGVTALGVLASVWSKYASGAVLATYVALGAGALAVRIVPVPALDPFRTLAPCWGQGGAGDVARHLLEAALAWGVLALVCFALAAWRLRPACVRQMEGRGRRRGALALRRPPVGDDPICWKEYHVEGLALLPFLRRLPRWAGVLVVGGLASVLTYLTAVASTGRAPGPPANYIRQALLFLGVLTLVVTVRAAGAVTGERERQTWDTLRLTALSPGRFLGGKLRGILNAVVPYYCAYAVPALLLSLPGDVPAVLSTTAGLVMAWPVVYFAAASGLNSSVFGRSTWRSIATALLVVYGVGLLAWFAASLVSFLTCGCLTALGPIPDQVFFVFALLAAAVLNAVAFIALGRVHMRQAIAMGFKTPRELPLALNVHGRKGDPV